MEIPEHLRTFRLIGRTTAFAAVRVYMHPMLKMECVIGHAINDGERRTNARIVDVTGLGGTYEAPGHEDCGERFDMHAGCVDCCTCAECGFDRAARLRRLAVDRYLSEIGAHVIQVEDLGAALEAYQAGYRVNDFPQRVGRRDLILAYEYGYSAVWNAQGQARLAHMRGALGEVGR